MIISLNPYPAYKDSGVPWLGQVPAAWELKALKRCVRINATALPDTTPADYEFRYIDIATVGTGFLTREPQQLRFSNAPSRARRVLHMGDTIVSTVRTYLKAVYYVHRDSDALVCSTGFAVLTPGPSTHPKYVSYLVQSNAFTDRVTAESFGTTYPAIAEGRLGSFYVPLPPLSEQTAIVRFLDYIDRRVRRCIRAKQKLTKLLEEYKQALIHQAVTGRIDVRTGQPYPAYKDSGVEWLRKVPESWNIVSLKRIAQFKSGSGFPVSEQGHKQGNIPFLRVSDMNQPGNEEWIDVFDSTVTRETANGLGAFVLPAGTIIFPKVGGALLTNKRRRLRRASCVDNNIMGCVVHAADADFVFVLLKQLDLGRLAKPGPVPALSEGDVRQILIALPPLSEQTAIVEYLDAQTAKIDAAMAAARREIELLREYRTRLIADVVTGKLDVREVAAQFPEEEAGSEEGSDEFTDMEAPEEGVAVEEGTEEHLSEEEVTV